MDAETFGLVDARHQKVVKANTLIQRSRQRLSVQQQKALLFLISQLTPGQTEFDWQTFEIADFCRVCGIEPQQGKNYRDVKAALQGLSDKSMWIKLDDDTESLVRWLNKIHIKPRSGKLQVRFDDDMIPFLLELKEKFTQFHLIHTLAMKSKYSIRLYELLKSYEKLGQVRFDLQRFKELVGIDYLNWYDIRRFVLETAKKEINALSDIEISYTPAKKGKAVASILFDINAKPKDSDTQILTEREIMRSLQGKKTRKKRGSLVPGQLELGSEGG